MTAPENIGWFVPFWLWMGLVVWGELAGLPFGVLLFTFFIVFFASLIPLFYRRVGLFRWWVFTCAVPALVAAVVIQGLRSLLHIA